MQCCRVQTAPAPTALARYQSLVLGERPADAPEWHIAAIDFITMALIRLLYDAKRGVVWLQYYDPRMGQGGRGVLVSLP